MEENLDGWIRVSDVLSMMPSYDWVAKKWSFPMQNIPEQVLTEKGELGTEVHAAIECHLRGDFYPLSKKEDPYFKSFLKWHEHINPQVVVSEKRFKKPSMKLTGKVDLIANIGGNTPVLIDFKNTAQPDHKKWAIQAALYHFLSRESHPKLSQEALFVQLDREGKEPTTHWYTINDQLMNSALSLYNSFIYLTKY